MNFLELKNVLNIQKNSNNDLKHFQPFNMLKESYYLLSFYFVGFVLNNKFPKHQVWILGKVFLFPLFLIFNKLQKVLNPRENQTHQANNHYLFNFIKIPKFGEFWDVTWLNTRANLSPSVSPLHQSPWAWPVLQSWLIIVEITETFDKLDFEATITLRSLKNNTLTV